MSSDWQSSSTKDPLAGPAKSTQHTAFSSLPVIDVGPLVQGDVAALQGTLLELNRAATDIGFLMVTGHGVSQAAIDAIKDAAKRYFALPLDIKNQHYIGFSENHSGYVPVGEERFYGSTKIDAKEAYDIGFDCEDEPSKRPMLGCNQWPELHGFRDAVQDYYQQVSQLGKRLLEGFALAMGLERDALTRFASAPPNQLRLIHYLHNPDAEADQPGIGAHTDYEFLTILLPTSPGLQVMNGLGEWVDVPVVPGTFVVNIGDMMEVFTNGKYVATSHRVKRVSEERYSFPMFCTLDYDTIVRPHPSFIEKDGPRYEALACGDHLYAQTIQTFEYLKQRLNDGVISMPSSAIPLSSFGRESK